MAKKQKYLTNKNLYHQIKLSHKQKKPTEELINMFCLLVDKIATRPNWCGYTFIEDMKQEAKLLLWLKWNKFNMDNDNPFSYFTQVVNNIFLQTIKSEARPSRVKDQLMVSLGLTPSYKAQVNYEEEERVKKDHNSLNSFGKE